MNKFFFFFTATAILSTFLKIVGSDKGKIYFLIVLYGFPSHAVKKEKAVIQINVEYLHLKTCLGGDTHHLR